jgi:hypothetical protein
MFFNSASSGPRVTDTADAVLPFGKDSLQLRHASDPATVTPTFMSTDGFGSIMSRLEHLLPPPPIVLLRTKQVCEREQDVR